MTYHDLKCPNCNAALQSVNGLDHYECPYCHSELLIDLDDGILKARVAKTEYDYKVWKARHDSWEKEQDFQRAERAKENEAKRSALEEKKFLLLLAGMAILAWLMLTIGIRMEEKEEMNRAHVPYSAGDLDDYSLGEAKAILETAGFTNITAIPTDKKFNNKEYSIKSISINGNTNFKAGDQFEKSDVIIITYYRKEG